MSNVFKKEYKQSVFFSHYPYKFELILKKSINIFYPMNHKAILSTLGIISIILLNSCSRVPITGRGQMKLLPNATMLSMSYTSYDEFLKTNKISNQAEGTRQVKQAGERIQGAVEKYMKEHGFGKKLEGFKWEFNLVEDPTVNAWCMPGGNVVFYTGILPICKDEAGIAVVMGHEVAHAIANHGNERMSQGLAAQMGEMGLSLALQNKPAETQALFLGAYGAASQVGALLPFSRLHESEADHMGLIFMAMAGYDPRTAPEFWKRMASLGGAKPPQLLSTHPSDETRIKNLESHMEEALRYYSK
jgi:predicted Zn-dependent protease